MTYTIYNQPPGDSGSRKKLINRKADVSDVDHAYSGIVNVYALVPTGSTTTLTRITGGEFSTPPGAKTYPQKPQQKETVNKTSMKKSTITLDENRVYNEYGWNDNSNLKIKMLYPKENGQFVYKGKSLAKPLVGIQYDQWLNNHPSLKTTYNISNNDDASKIRASKLVLMKYTPGTKEFERTLSNQAMKLHVPIRQMRDWYYSQDKVLHVDEKYRTSELQNFESLVKDQMVDKISITNPSASNNPKVRAMLHKFNKGMVNGIPITDTFIDSVFKVLDTKYGVTERTIKGYVKDHFMTDSKNQKARDLLYKRGMKDSDIDTVIRIVKSESKEDELTKPGVHQKVDITLPIPSKDLPKLSLSAALANPSRYQEEKSIDVLQRYYKEYGGGSSSPINHIVGTNKYYIDMTKLKPAEYDLQLRRRKLSKSKLSRVVSKPKSKVIKKNIPKCSKSKTMKKSILSRLKCKCRRK